MGNYCGDCFPWRAPHMRADLANMRCIKMGSPRSVWRKVKGLCPSDPMWTVQTCCQNYMAKTRNMPGMRQPMGCMYFDACKRSVLEVQGILYPKTPALR